MRQWTLLLFSDKKACSGEIRTDVQTGSVIPEEHAGVRLLFGESKREVWRKKFLHKTEYCSVRCTEQRFRHVCPARGLGLLRGACRTDRAACSCGSETDAFRSAGPQKPGHGALKDSLTQKRRPGAAARKTAWHSRRTSARAFLHPLPVPQPAHGL